MSGQAKEDGGGLAGIIAEGVAADPGHEREPDDAEREQRASAERGESLKAKNVKAIKTGLAMAAAAAVAKGYQSVGRIPAQTVDGVAYPAAEILASYGIDLEGYTLNSPWVALAYGAWVMAQAVREAVEADRQAMAAAAAKPVGDAPA